MKIPGMAIMGVKFKKIIYAQRKEKEKAQNGDAQA
jgi:hypothetical protein